MKNQLITSSSIFLITMLIVIMVLLSYFSKERFRQGSENYAESALSLSNTISANELSLLENGTLLVLEDNSAPLNNNKLLLFSFNLNDIGSNSYLKSLRKTESPLIIVADDPGIESRVWTILAQRGVKDLLIYQEYEDETDLKHEFRPDTDVSK